MPIKIFFCYARADQQFLEELKSHLLPMQHNGLIKMWHDQNISAGREWVREIADEINTSQIILLLISRHFMSSDYCYSIEMKQAMERHKRGEARVIPIILRPTLWQNAPFGKLQALPQNAKPVTHRSWGNRSEAFLSIAQGIQKVVAELTLQPAGKELFNEMVIKIQELRLTTKEYDKLTKLIDDKKREQYRKERTLEIIVEVVRKSLGYVNLEVVDKLRKIYSV
jgi:TIR domain